MAVVSEDLTSSFSEICGENILLSGNRNSAKWCHKYSAGRIFTNRPFKEDDKVEIILDGSGHVGFGFTTSDPGLISDLRNCDGNKNKVKLVTDIRCHKRECVVKIGQRCDKDSRKLNIEYSDQRVVAKCKKEEQIWLTFDLKFGSVSVKIKSEDLKFHHNAGRNIHFEGRERRSAKLEVEFPAITCCLWRKLRRNEYATLTVVPLKDGEKDPSTYHMVIGASELDAIQLRSRDPESFKADSRIPMPYRWKVINRFDKDVCYGEVKVGINGKGKIVASHASGFEKELDFDPEKVSSEFLFVFNLFRTEVRIVNVVREEIVYDYALQSFRRKISNVDTTDSYYVDLIDENTPTNAEKIERKRSTMRSEKGRSDPIGLSPLVSNDKRNRLSDSKLHYISEEHYDDVGVDIGCDSSPDLTVLGSNQNVTGGKQELLTKVNENKHSSNMKERKLSVEELIYDEVEFNESMEHKSLPTPPVHEENIQKSKLKLKAKHLKNSKPVSKIVDTVQEIKAIFKQKPERHYDEIEFSSDDNEECKTESKEKCSQPNKNPLGNTLVSIPAEDSNVSGQMYWEVKECQKEQKQAILAQSKANIGVGIGLVTESPEQIQTSNSKSRARDKVADNETDLQNQMTDRFSDDVENSSGQRVNVKMLIERFGNMKETTDNNGTNKAQVARPPGIRFSPSAPNLVSSSIGLHRSETEPSNDLSGLKDESYDKRFTDNGSCKSCDSNTGEKITPNALADDKPKTGVLGDTFKSINVLLNIGKPKKVKKAKDKKK